MSRYTILAWQPLMRPPLPSEATPGDLGIYDAPLKALTCRNQVTSVMALVTADEPVERARLIVSDLASERSRIPSDGIVPLLVGTVPTPEGGVICDPLFEVEEFAIDKSAAFYVRIKVPEDTPSGVYHGTIALLIDGDDVATNRIEVQVADVELPDVHDWEFFLNVWMNPATIARWHGVEMWSQEHLRLLRPYVQDLALHGQKVAVVPICHQPWGTQTRDPFPNTIRWTKRGDDFEFDFSVFDRYIDLHERCGIDRAIHCYSIVQGPGDSDTSVIEYLDAATGESKTICTKVGDEAYTSAWGAFFQAFTTHLDDMGWLDKTYIAFDEKPPEIMEAILGFLGEHVPDLKVSLAGASRDDLVGRIDDLSLLADVSEGRLAVTSPPERSAMGVAQLLDPMNMCAISKRCPAKMTTTFYVCCKPEFPNTFVFSPLVESRMLPWLALQGGFDGFLRWSYNDWPDDPFTHPEWNGMPTGDVFLVYPGENGPVSSLRWEQLREGIADYELAMIASANIQGPEEMVDYEQAITLACRDMDGRTKSTGDIEIARRLLMPIAQHQTMG